MNLADSDYLTPTRTEALTALGPRHSLGSRPTRQQLAAELATRGKLNDVAHDSTLRRALRPRKTTGFDSCELVWLAIQCGLLQTAAPICEYCLGDGQVPCASCDGHGRRRKAHTDRRGRVYHREGPCKDCGASGHVGCPDCGGDGFMFGA